jgi:hypothetical protein
MSARGLKRFYMKTYLVDWPGRIVSVTETMKDEGLNVTVSISIEEVTTTVLISVEVPATPVTKSVLTIVVAT